MAFNFMGKMQTPAAFGPLAFGLFAVDVLVRSYQILREHPV